MLGHAAVDGLLMQAGLHGPWRLRLLKRSNDVYSIATTRATYFLKLPSKDWYADDPWAWAGAVQHEAAAYACLARHGLEAPEVVLALTSADNPLGRPCLVTRGLAGAPLTTLLADAANAQFGRLMARAGEYLARMHAIRFAFPGYIMDPDGPVRPPHPDQWYHSCWIVPAGETPRFVHGDCHAHQVFLNGGQVTGVVDMEVASAGDAGWDLVKLALELAVTYPPPTRWWEPLFSGYGGAPDFEVFKLRMLGAGPENYACFGPDAWRGPHEHILRRLRDARDWSALFTTR